MGESDIPKTFTAEYYDYYYFADDKGKKFRKANGSIGYWGYRNKLGWWEGCKPIAKAWKIMFEPQKMLDVGCGRGPFVLAARQLGIEAYGFDFSPWAVGEGRVEGCKPEWLRLHDATKPWPYRDREFDLVVALDFYEHIYVDDLDFVIDEMYRVACKWVFLQIAVAGTGGLQGRSENGYILRKGEPVPVELEGCAVAGHVTVMPEEWWYERLDREEWIPRRDMVQWFISLVPKEVLANWLKNAIIVMERIE